MAGTNKEWVSLFETGGSSGGSVVSPTIDVTEITNGHRVSITDIEGTETFDILDGTNGTNGTNGTDGTNGTNGTDGADGADGADGTTFTPSVSNAGVISWTNDGNKTNPTSVDLVAAVIAALPSATGVSF